MKIEIGESLGYSYLRHVKECWLVQTNWKPSPHWPRFMDNTELDEMFAAMKRRFDDAEGKVFKQTRTAEQFLQQAEIDVMGVDREGGVYAIDVAFHEAGLNYGGGADVRVLKKLLRTVMALRAYRPRGTQIRIIFASPKVNRGVQRPLETMSEELKAEFPHIEWELLTNDAFTEHMLQPTLEKASVVNDTAELFMRAAKLLASTPHPPNGDPVPDGIQPLVQNLMRTLLNDYPTLLDGTDERNMMNRDYCRNQLRLQIGNFPLLHRKEEGSSVRYWREVYGDRYYVCSQWGKRYHRANAESLLQFVNGVVQKKQDHPQIPVLENIRRRLQEYVG